MHDFNGNVANITTFQQKTTIFSRPSETATSLIPDEPVVISP
jgi:hypothetical protein